MEFDLTRLRHILSVARHRSISRAAEELLITQPALSRSIASFERTYGVRLFDRGRGGVLPTSVGKLVIEQAEAVVGSARDLEHNLKLYGNGQAGRIAFGLGPLAASLILPQLSRELLNSRPSLQLRASIKDADHLLEELLADEIEVIFANSGRISASPEVTTLPIGAIRLAIIVRGSHPLASSKSIQMSDLRAFPVANAVELPVVGLTGEAGSFVCDNYHILREAVLGTDCVCLASPDLLTDDLTAGRLISLDVSDFGPVRSNLDMIRRRGRMLSPAAEVVADSVRAICAT